MSYNDDYRNSGTGNSMDISSMEPLDSDAERKSGAEREDASKWDQMSDTQRKLIAFGVLIGIVVFLVLMLAVGSSCGACSGCSCANTSASDAADEDIQTGTVIDEATSGADVQFSNDAVVPDKTVSGGDVSASDIPDDGVEYVEVVRPGGLSACSHKADNEAGGGSDAGNGGFLGFLFGCSGCAEGCTIDVNSNLSDKDYDDPTRLDGAILSGSDTDSGRWEAQPDDEAYMELLRSQLTVISEQVMQLSELDTVLAPYTDPQRVRENDRFRKLTEGMLEWCDAAEGYDATLLQGDAAHACNMLSVRLAGDLRRYIDEYPLIITGAASGADVLAKGDHLNAIMGDIVELYAVLNPAPAPTTAPEEITE